MNYFELNPKQNYGFIYRYISPSNKSYIGQTRRSPKERAGKDGYGYKRCSVFYSAIKKYGFENFKFEILEEVPVKELGQKEQYYINFYNSLIPNGYNCAKGGDDYFDGRTKRERPIDKYDLNGNFIKSYHLVIEAAKDEGIPYQTISACLSGRRTHHKNFVYAYQGQEIDLSFKVVQTHGRKTGQYDLDGKFIKEHKSANEAARNIGKNSNAGRNIRSVCEGERKTAYGFIWKFLD